MVEKGRDLSRGPRTNGYEDLFSHEPPSGPAIGSIGDMGVVADRLDGSDWRYTGIRRLARLQLVLTFGIVFVLCLFIYLVFLAVPSAGPNTGHGQAEDQSTNGLVDARPNLPTSQEPQQAAPAPIGPVSRMTAEQYFSNGQFDLAVAVYKSLISQVAGSTENEAARDFFVFRQAQCEIALGRPELAEIGLRTAGNSRYPVIRAMARYHLGLGADHNRRYLDAGREFYQALALADTVAAMGPWVEEFRRCCHYMIARAITMEALSLREDPAGLPPALAAVPKMADPWARLDDDQWQTVIRSCASLFNDATIGPIIEPAQSGPDQGWRVICNGAGLEEVLKRLSARTGLDIGWTWQGTTGTTVVDQAARKRPVYVFVDGASPQQAVAMVAGSVGLFVQKAANGSMAIIDPYNYRSLGEHISWLRQQAISIWHQFRSDWDQTDLIARSYLATGLLYEHDGQPAEAIAQYALLSSRSLDLELVPHALWRSGRLRSELGDYAGAREDLSRLTEQYPQCPMASAALMALAEAMISVGRYDEAARVAVRSYHSSTAPSEQKQAALMVGRSLYLAGQYPQAIRWLDRYLELAERGSPQSKQALLWLGRSYLAMGQLAAAARSLEQALDGARDVSEYMDNLGGLVEVYLGLGDYLKALALLEGQHPVYLRQKDRTDMAVLKARVLASMGLKDRSAALLEEYYRLSSDPNQRLSICIDLGRCYQALGQWERARAVLTEALMNARPGPLVGQVMLDLAYVSHRLGRYEQVVSLCQQVLGADAPSQLKAKASDLLYDAYIRQGQYDLAARALVWSDKR